MVNFQISRELETALDEVRALLPVSEANSSLEELVLKMAKLSKEKLSERKFGKKRTAGKVKTETENRKPKEHNNSTPTPERQRKDFDQEIKEKRSRYVSQKTRFEIWQRDRAQCQNCGSKRALEIDHVYSYGRGGGNEIQNLRLLCHHCNQRQRIKKFGFAVAESRKEKSI